MSGRWRNRAAPFGILLAVPLAAPAAGQDVRLDKPVATFGESFGLVQSVRELPGGRVLVADPLGQALVIADLAAGTADTIGRVGQGPEEYRQPDAVWPLAGGASLLVDLGNGRLAEVRPDGTFGATSPIAIGEPGPGRELVLAIPRGVDRDGRVYTRSMGRMGGGALPDSAAILRLDRATGKVDTVAMVKLEDRTEQSSGGPNNRNVQISPVPLSPADAFGVAPDGSVVVARSADYHVEWIRPDGTVIRGPAVPYEAVAIGRDEKAEWDREQQQSGGGIGVRVEAVNGRMSMSFARGGPEGARQRELDSYPWPQRKPPFYDGRIIVDSRGNAWVRRHVKAGAPPTYDVFDGQARQVRTVTLPEGRRLIASGENALYAVWNDEFDLQYLEKYALPTS